MIGKFTHKTLIVLGSLIKVERTERLMSQTSLAERLGVSRQTIIAIEKGDPNVSVGTVFEAAYIVGIPLMTNDQASLEKWQAILADFSALLPKRISQKKPRIDNDF
ncbi:MAG: hypothetical protein A3F18_05030 [Legionellales bacterium RIFCSPHIGHO2_12_FULL_37_14]|nr:MAG: hypothetical protein A3F18_05030 [Legionellales bacterium RIFCSPHIGHO2_12_FULL_37_14]